MEIGGLHIIGSERHESRRIDRQLRGRAGRQGDPGASQFFLSLEDDLMRLFGSERIAKLMDRMGAQEGEVLTHPLITRSIEQAQKRVELQNFQARKRLLEYDDVMNQQREVIYSLRAFALEGGEELKGEALKMIEKARHASRVETTLAEYEDAEEWDFDLLRQDLLMHYLLQRAGVRGSATSVRPTIAAAQTRRGRGGDEGVLRRSSRASTRCATRWAAYGDRLLSLVMLNVLDEKWKDHLYDLDQLRNAIHYRSWGQKDPLIEYKQEAYTMFVDLMNDIYNTFTERFLKVQLVFEQPPRRRRSRSPPSRAAAAPTKRYNALGILEDVPAERRQRPATGTDAALDIGPAETPAARSRSAARKDPAIVGAGTARGSFDGDARAAAGGRDWSNVGRNDPCPCGSGKKFKKCHGANAVERHPVSETGTVAGSSGFDADAPQARCRGRSAP